jgi:hypothetical protein
MIEKNKQLIAYAKKLHPMYWDKVNALIEEADTPEAKEELQWIKRRLNWREEGQFA